MKQILFFIILLVAFSCQSDDLEKDTETLGRVTRSNFPGQSLSGNMNPFVGEDFYSYTVNLDKATTEKLKITISSIGGGPILGYGALEPVHNCLTFDLPQGSKTFSFKAYWTQEIDNACLIVVGESSSGHKIDVSLDDINIKRRKIEISALASSIIGDNVTFSALFPEIPGYDKNHRVNWKYDKNFFDYIIEDVNSQGCSITLKAKKSGYTNVEVFYDELYKKSFWVTTSQGRFCVNIIDPFRIFIDRKTCCPNSFIVARMPDFNLAKQAKVFWSASANLLLVGGQNTQESIFKVSGTSNGYCSIKADVQYNGSMFHSMIDSIWVGKPIITTDSLEYNMVGRNRVCIKADVAGVNPLLLSEQVKWEIISGHGTIGRFSDNKGFYIESTAPLEVSDKIIALLTAVNQCGTTSKEITVNVPELSFVEIKNVHRDVNSISGILTLPKQNVGLELYLDWAVPEGGKVIFKIQDDLYEYEGGGSEFKHIQLTPYSNPNIGITLENVSQDTGIGGIYITGSTSNVIVGQNSSIFF